MTSPGLGQPRVVGPGRGSREQRAEAWTEAMCGGYSGPVEHAPTCRAVRLADRGSGLGRGRDVCGGVGGRPPAGRGIRCGHGSFPLNVEFAYPGGAALASAALLVAATFVGLAALQTAAVMRVLDPDRHLPPSPPSVLRRARSVMLGALDARSGLVEDAPDLPPAALLGPEELARRDVLRCTVLIPAHNEEAILGLTLTSLAEQSRPPDRVVVVADNCTDATVEVARSAWGRGVRDGRQHREEGRSTQPAAGQSAAPAPGHGTW